MADFTVCNEHHLSNLLQEGTGIKLKPNGEMSALGYGEYPDVVRDPFNELMELYSSALTIETKEIIKSGWKLIGHNYILSSTMLWLHFSYGMMF